MKKRDKLLIIDCILFLLASIFYEFDYRAICCGFATVVSVYLVIETAIDI